jgi:hypothetical protein
LAPVHQTEFFYRGGLRNAVAAKISAGADVSPYGADQSAFAGPLAKFAAAIPEAVAGTLESS